MDNKTGKETAVLITIHYRPYVHDDSHHPAVSRYIIDPMCMMIHIIRLFHFSGHCQVPISKGPLYTKRHFTLPMSNQKASNHCFLFKMFYSLYSVLCISDDCDSLFCRLFQNTSKQSVSQRRKQFHFSFQWSNLTRANLINQNLWKVR